jgi:hypothetical protein
MKKRAQRRPRSKRRPQPRTPKPREKYSAAAMIRAIDETKGLLTVAAKRLGCSPDTIHRYRKTHPKIEEAIQNARNSITDLAEAALYKAIQAGEAWAVCFYLKTQGKGRGYIERTEHQLSSSPDSPLRIEVVYKTQPAPEFGLPHDAAGMGLLE